MINYNKEMRAFINKIKHIGLQNKGIIFGGLVRCDIIGGHYKSEFFKKNLDIEYYWDVTYDVETSYRTIIPNDMDIYFRSEDEVNIFINCLEKFIKKYVGYIEVIKNFNSKNLKYICKNEDTISHTKINIEIKIGNTISYNGIKLKFSIDVIFINNNTEFGSIPYIFEPPFYNLDFLSNIFLIQNVNGVYDIRLSNCSGTPIDQMNYIQRAKVTAVIMNNIINFRTVFIRQLASFNAESINCYRIIKMIEYGWNITNLPFIISDINDFDNKDEEKCCVCLELISVKSELNSDNKIAKITTTKNKSNILHYKCFINYLKTEQRKLYTNQITGEIECRCPYRIPFNFKDCHKNVSYDI